MNNSSLHNENGARVCPEQVPGFALLPRWLCLLPNPATAILGRAVAQYGGTR